MRPDLKVMKLDDGRDLAWIELGDPAGEPVFALHGSPGQCHGFAVYDQTARECGVRFVALDRPGYGHSSYRPRRRIEDFPSDVSQLADHLDVERFAVIGHSAGGPHALVCARFLADRVSVCGVVSGVAPSGRPDTTDGMMRSNRAQEAIYRHWPVALDPLAAALGWLAFPLVAAALKYGRRHAESGLDRFNRVLPSCDVEVLSRPEIRAELLAEARGFTPALARTSMQDMALCFRDWGFDLEDIEVPVHIWQGDLDRNVPPVHGSHLAQIIPSAIFHECPGEGHWLLVDHMGEILKLVTSDSP